MEQLSTLAIESELYAPNDAIKGTFQILGEMKKEREWTLKELQKIYRQHWSFPKDYENRIPQLPEDMKVGEYAQDILSAIVESPFRKFHDHRKCRNRKDNRRTDDCPDFRSALFCFELWTGNR